MVVGQRRNGHRITSSVRAYNIFVCCSIEAREPVLALDQDLRVITASRSFYRTSRLDPKMPKAGRGDGHWDIPKLRLLLEKIAPESGVMEDYQVEI
jgi:hypothetical protein